jgi:integrase
MINQPSDMILLTPATPMPFEQFSDQFLSQYRSENYSKATLKKMCYIIKLLGGLGVTSTDQLDYQFVTRFIQSRPPERSPHYTRGLLTQLRVVCSYAEGRRCLQVSPFRLRRFSQWIRVRNTPAEKRHQSIEEVRQLLAHLKSKTEGRRPGWQLWYARRLYGLVATVAFTALRASEAQRLHVEDVDLTEGIINLIPRDCLHLKTDAAAQALVVPRALVPILSDWTIHRLDAPRGFVMPSAEDIPWMFPGSTRTCAWTGGGAGFKPVDCLKSAALEAGIEGVTFQSLRRSWATAAERVGIPQAMISRQCRHTSVETTRKWYQQRDMNSLKETVSGFDY